MPCSLLELNFFSSRPILVAVSVSDSLGLEHTHLSTPEFTSKANRVLFFGHVEYTRLVESASVNVGARGGDTTDSAVGLLASRVTQELSRQFMEELTHNSATCRLEESQGIGITSIVVKVTKCTSSFDVGGNMLELQ